MTLLQNVFAPLIAAEPIPLLTIVSSVAVGLCVLVAAWSAGSALSSEGIEQDDEWRYDATRINELRRSSSFYRFFQPLILKLASLNRRIFRDSLPEIGRQIQAAGLPRYWTAAEYLARIELIALLVAPIWLYVCVVFAGPMGIALAVVFTILTGYLLRRNLAARAHRRLTAIKRRLPFLLDLLTLLMEAGSTFLQSLAEAVREFQSQAVGVEFGRVLAEMGMGKNRTEALESLRLRLNDDEISSIVGSIIQGEQLGTPLGILFRAQADVLRLKRSQRAETVANEAGVKMLLPAVIVMVAIVLIILGPFVLNFIYFDLMS